MKKFIKLLLLLSFLFGFIVLTGSFSPYANDALLVAGPGDQEPPPPPDTLPPSPPDST